MSGKLVITGEGTKLTNDYKNMLKNVEHKISRDNGKLLEAGVKWQMLRGVKRTVNPYCIV